MNILKVTMKFLIFACMISLAACQNQQTPTDLEDGLYAQFVTNKGDMTAKLFYKQTPVTVANFVALAEGTHPNVKDEYKGKRYYDGIIFHRVIDKFMIQGGDPTGTGSGDPGYKFQDEFVVGLKHDKPGILSMANAGPKSNGSQFFITEVPTPFLDYKHTVFGELVKGLDVQDSISNVKTIEPRRKDKPEQDVVIEKINIIRVGKDAKAFDAAKVFTEQEALLDKRLTAFKDQLKAEKEAEAKKQAEDFIANNSDKGTEKRLPTGLIMMHKAAENGVQPKPGQKVEVSYAGYFASDNSLFDTSDPEIAKANNKFNERKPYKNLEVPYDETAQLIAGFKEAILNMKVGDEARVFIPYHLGYGERRYGPIPGRSNLIFDIKLVSAK